LATSPLGWTRHAWEGPASTNLPLRSGLPFVSTGRSMRALPCLPSALPSSCENGPKALAVGDKRAAPVLASTPGISRVAFAVRSGVLRLSLIDCSMPLRLFTSLTGNEHAWIAWNGRGRGSHRPVSSWGHRSLDLPRRRCVLLRARFPPRSGERRPFCS
jgi:hypothetical protein